MVFGNESAGREIDEDSARQALVRDLSIRQSRTREDAGFLHTAAKIGFTIGAVGLLGRTIPRDYLIEALGTMGRLGQTVTAPVGHFARGMMDELAGVSRRAPAAIRNFDLIESITKSLEVYRMAKPGRTTAELQEIVSATRQGLRDVGFEDLNRHGMDRLRAATVGDILSSHELQNAIGGQSSSSFKVIDEALRLGMIGTETRLTRGSVGGIFIREGAGSSAQILDTRFASPRNIMRGMYNLARNLRVPFTGFRPVDLIAGVMRPFGEGEFAGMVGPDLPIGVTKAADGTLSTVMSGPGLNFVIGGRLLRQSGHGFEVAAENIRIGRMGKVGQARLERYGVADEYFAARMRRIKRARAGGRLEAVTELEDALGLGPDFRTRDPALKTFVVDPIRRKAEGRVAARPYVQRREVAGFLERYRIEAEAEELGIDPEILLSQAVVNPKADGQLSLIDKARAYLGLGGPGIAVKPNAVAPFAEGDLTVQSVEYTGKLAGRRGLLPEETFRGDPLVSPTHLGGYPVLRTTPIQHYAYTGKSGGFLDWVQGQTEALLDVLHYGTNRTGDLFGATLGVGFRPSVGKGIAGGFLGLGKNLAKMYGIVAGVQGAIEYLNYADYLSEMVIEPVVTGFGAIDHPYTSVKKIGIGLYQGAQLIRTGVRDALQVDNAARYLEDLMPGSIDSGASFLARTVGIPLAGLAKGGITGFKSAGALALLVGGTEPGKTFSEQLAEFTGEKEVPIRKSRWWALGRQPFEGGQIDYFAPHWTRRHLYDPAYTDVLYGSKSEYFTNVARIPTPHNLFGLVPLLQEGSIFSGGDLYLAKKHSLTRPYPDTPGVNTEEALIMANYLASRGPYDPPFAAGQRLGYGTAGTLPETVQEHGFLSRIGSAVDELTELSGIYKFMFYDIWGGGEGGPPKLATYETMNSSARAFYDANLGGLLGMTEMYRRFVSPDEARQGVNPVPNLMPTWLPGMRSEHIKDRQYHIDFTLGDPYAKLSRGESRLPGAGYEVMHRLHSGAPGVYDAMDRFLILADVAPNSDAYKQYRVIVENWAQSGVLDRYWSQKFNVAKKQVADKMDRYRFYDRRFTGLITDSNSKRTADKYNLIEKAVGGTWEVLSHDLLPKAAKVVPFGDSLIDKLLPTFSPIEHYERFQVYGEEFGDWRSPWKSFLRPKIAGLTAEDPLMAAAGGASFALFGSNPMAALALGITGGLSIGGAAAANSISTGRWASGQVPEHRQRQWELEQYFDNLQYVKGRMLQQRAIAMQDQELADHYKDLWSRTTAAIDYRADRKDFMRQAIRGLSREQRAYFKSFIGMPEVSQNYILQMMPEQVKPVFIAGADRMGERKFAKYRKYSQQRSDTRVANYFRSVGGLPDSGWGGWHPDVPMDAVKIKMVDAGWNSTSADIHKFSLFNEHRYRASRFENLTVPQSRDLSYVDRDDGGHANLIAELQAAGFQNVRLRPGLGGQMDNIQWNVRRSTWEQVKETISEMF